MQLRCPLSLSVQREIVARIETERAIVHGNRELNPLVRGEGQEGDREGVGRITWRP